VLFKSDFPLRCFSVLGVGADRGVPDSVRMAIGSNAKSIYTLSYARSELAASRNMGIVGGPGPGVTLQAELSNIHTGSVYCMDWHEGAGLLVSGSNDKVIRLSK
jgi:WD40 repeat protein